MRTEQFLTGYDACRNVLQSILTEYPELQKITKLMILAQYPYYEDDGKDWHPDCKGCKNWDYNDLDNYWCCFLKIKIEDIKEHCSKKEVKK